MKELLKTVLQDDLNVAATPANNNVVRSISLFAQKLTGDEDVIIVEFGEERPGDIAMFAELFCPDIALITGAAPAHLSHYKTVQAINDDLLSIANYVDQENIFYNAESPLLLSHIGQKFSGYTAEGIKDWKVSGVKIAHDKTKFKIAKAKKIINVESGLLGRHQIGPISAAVFIAHELGLRPKQIEAAVKKTEPFEHRMQPRKLNGAWLIDDTYNGNLEGVKAGIELMKDIKSKRKIYVTPGLVEQGEESQSVHNQIGLLLGRANPDKIILMNNSVTNYIKSGLDESGYTGELTIEKEPLKFYSNIEHILASGDLVVMQNDWPDSYR